MAVAKKPGKGAAKSQVPAKVEDNLPAEMLAEMEEAAGAGFEEADQESYAIPFMRILQTNSPQVNEDDPAYVEGAKAGMILNNVSGEIFDGAEGFNFIPCFYRRSIIQWGDRNAGLGFMGDHPVNTPLLKKTHRNDKGQDELEDGSILMDTRSHYGLVETADGEWIPVILAMSSTQLKKSRAWMTKMSGVILRNLKGKAFNPPMYGQVYHMTSMGESNSKGSWKGWKIDYVGPVVDVDLYQAAGAFKEQVASGSTKPVYDESSETPSEKTGEEPF